MVQISLPDGKKLEFDHPVTGREIAEKISPKLARDAVGVFIDGELRDLGAALENDAHIKILTVKSDPEAAVDLMRHSCAHVMAEAICRLFPETKLVYGPTVENGFYYDIDLERPVTPDDFAAIEEQMGQIVAADEPFTRIEMSYDEGMKKVQAEGNPYKVENAQRARGEVLSFYYTGEPGEGKFEDLCRGPHIPKTGYIGAYKVMSVAGAYFHGDAKEKMLQRIYGTAFADKKQLKQYLNQIEEAKKRDHRVLGRQLDLFSFHEEGPGFAFFHPKGMVVWNAMVDYWRSIHKDWNYKEIRTPIILNEKLWHQSGH